LVYSDIETDNLTNCSIILVVPRWQQPQSNECRK